MKKEITERRGIGWQTRLASTAIGVFLCLYGYAKVKQGLWFYRNYRNEDVPALFV